MIMGSGHQTSNERLGDSGEEKAQGDLIKVHGYLMEGVKKTYHSGAQREDKWYRTQIKIQVIPFKQKKSFFIVRVVKQWNMLPRKVVESPSLEILRTQLYMVLSNLLLIHPALSRALGLNNLQTSLPNLTPLRLFRKI